MQNISQNPASAQPTNNQSGSEAPLETTASSGTRLRERKPPVGTLAREIYEEGKALQAKYGWSNER